jgi:hypothetical protein
MTATHEAWTAEGWRGWIDPGADVDPQALLAVVARGEGRRSRHARTVEVESAAGALIVKSWEPPGGWRALRAFRMGEALRADGFGAPPVVLVGARDGAGLLVMRHVGGDDPAALAARLDRPAKRTLLGVLGREVGRLHAAGFVHGDLVPPNLRVVGGRLVFLDNDRTRRNRLLVAVVARRNLVQLGRFVVRGLTVTDRARVLRAYAAERGLGREARHRLARWVIAKTIARRCAIDGIPPALAARAGFRELMRSGGPFDPTDVGGAA